MTKAIRLFNGRWSVFWATTYSFELQLFDGFLFPRLGEAPLNATVMLDERHADSVWESIPPDESWRLRRVNSDYLIRGVAFGNGAFHPKTYFFANDREGILLVGSGNLSSSGLDRGNEVFARFDSSNEDDIGAIRQWREWMSDLVERSGDEQLSSRWFNVRSQAKWLSGPAAGSFVSNRQTPIRDAFLADLKAPVDELHLTAPFFDPDAQATSALIEALDPKELFVYLADQSNVEGPVLRKALEGANGTPHLVRYSVPFVHAKLVAAIQGSTGRLLSGSANLSRAAMFATPEPQGWANVEAGTLISAPADQVRELFHPEHIETSEVSLDELDELTYELPSDEESATFEIRLLTASLQDDHTIKIATSIPVGPSLRLTDGVTILSLDPAAAGTTAGFPESDEGRLVWLLDVGGEQVSNKVPLDNPNALQRMLALRDGNAERVRELDRQDLDTPIGKMLQSLNELCIFDIEETDAGKRTQQVLSEQDQPEEDPAFWERLGQEELLLDRRTAHYRSLAHGPMGEDDDVFRLLRLMLEKTPEQRRALLLQPPPNAPEGEPEGGQNQIPRTWTPTARLKVRLNNVLRRWCLALGDPKLAWLSPFAPVRNFEALATALADCWENEYLEEPKLLVLIQTLCERFVGTPRLPGYLASLDDERRDEALLRLTKEARAVATALVFAALRPSGRWSDMIFDWQGFLVPGCELRLFESSDEAANLASRLVGIPTSIEDIAERFEWAVTYIDDPHWCARMAEELGLTAVTFSDQAFDGPYKASLGIEGVDDPLADPRVARLVKELFDYRRTQGIVMLAGHWRVSIRIGGQAFARSPDKEADLLESNLITREDLAELAASGATLGELFQPPGDPLSSAGVVA